MSHKDKMDTDKKTITIHYINSLKEHLTLEVSTHNSFYNLMELIRDEGYEEWGDCQGRSWCRTCHVAINKETSKDIQKDEAHALTLLSNRSSSSRLACQIAIHKDLDGATLYYLGDN